MNADMLLQHFNRISEAPDSVARLRSFILDLAVRGKLVEQDPNDEPAAELLKRIQAEKARLMKKDKADRQDPFVAPSGAEIPFHLPNTWAWVPATYPAYLISDLGKKVQTKDVLETGKFPVVDQGKVFIRGYSNDSEKVIQVKSPIILFGDHTRETKLIDFDFIVGADGVKLLQPVCLLTTYYYLALQWLPLNSRGYGRHFKLLRASLLPLPPLAEQHRIVAKVDELMALCDQLQVAQNEREARRDRLVASSLHRIGTAPATADEAVIGSKMTTPLPEAARFHLAHLPRLITRPEHIKQLRQTVLNLAVRGRLVPQDPNDEPAAELLKRIEVEKNRLTQRRQGAKKNEQPNQENLGQESLCALAPWRDTPFALPVNWQWVRFGELIEGANSGWSPKAEGFPRSGDNWGVLKVSAVSWDKFLPEENKQLLPGVLPPESAAVHCGDFLISRANTSELVAKCVVVEDEPKNLILSDKIVRLQLASECSKRFLCIANNSADYARAYYAEQASGTSLSMKNVSRPVIYGLAIPLPPLAEQHRIVAKVDELMTLCDQLEAQLTTTQTDSRRLLEAVLRDALTLEDATV